MTDLPASTRATPAILAALVRKAVTVEGFAAYLTTPGSSPDGSNPDWPAQLRARGLLEAGSAAPRWRRTAHGSMSFAARVWTSRKSRRPPLAASLGPWPQWISIGGGLLLGLMRVDKRVGRGSNAAHGVQRLRGSLGLSASAFQPWPSAEWPCRQPCAFDSACVAAQLLQCSRRSASASAVQFDPSRELPASAKRAAPPAWP